MKVYELINATNEEMYFPLGVFSNLEDLLKKLDGHEEPPCDEDHEDCIVLEVKERELDKWEDHGKTVAKRIWEKVYNEKEDDYQWKIKDPLNPTP